MRNIDAGAIVGAGSEPALTPSSPPGSEPAQNAHLSYFVKSKPVEFDGFIARPYAIVQ